MARSALARDPLRDQSGIRSRARAISDICPDGHQAAAADAEDRVDRARRVADWKLRRGSRRRVHEVELVDAADRHRQEKERQRAAARTSPSASSVALEGLLPLRRRRRVRQVKQYRRPSRRPGSRSDSETRRPCRPPAPPAWTAASLARPACAAGAATGPSIPTAIQPIVPHTRTRPKSRSRSGRWWKASEFVSGSVGA